MGVIYTWKDNFRANVKADVVGEVLEKLEQSEEGLTAQAFVDASRPEDAPTHKMFEWRDDVAAEKYREQQARVIINHITIKYETVPEPQRAYFHIYHDEPTYKSVGVIKQSEEDMSALLEMARRELLAFEKKYAILRKELKAVFDAIDGMGGET